MNVILKFIQIDFHLKSLMFVSLQLGIDDHHQAFPVGHHLPQLRRIRRRGVHRRMSADERNAQSRRNNDSR